MNVVDRNFYIFPKARIRLPTLSSGSVVMFLLVRCGQS